MALHYARSSFRRRFEAYLLAMRIKVLTATLVGEFSPTGAFCVMGRPIGFEV
jgi:hypothetical protein